MSVVRILIAFALAVGVATAQMDATVSCVLTPNASLWADGLLPNATYVATELPLDIAATLNANVTRITLTAITHSSDNTTYNATFNFGPSSNASAAYVTGYALGDLFSATVQNASTTELLESYNAFLLKYAVTNVTVRSIDSTTLAPPPTTTTTRAATTTTAVNGTTPNTTTLVITSETAPTLTPLPTNTDPSNSNTTYNNVDDGSDSGGGLIYAIIFGIIGGILLIGCITWAVKTFVMRERKDNSKRGGGYKYATSRAQHN